VSVVTADSSKKVTKRKISMREIAPQPAGKVPMRAAVHPERGLRTNRQENGRAGRYGGGDMRTV